MKIHKLFALIILSLGLFSSGANAQTKKRKTAGKSKAKITKRTVKPAPKPPIDVPTTDYKILLEGSQSKIKTPFIFIARDAETYASMRGLVEGLPASSTIDFSKTAVVAAFAGMRNTGGWLVAIRQAADKTVIDATAPPKGSMTTQVITYPFQVALMPIDQDQALNIEAAPMWTNNLTIYRVSKGNFEYSGGIAGRSKKFDAEGSIGVLTYGEHLTYIFNLSGKGSEAQRKLTETASGVMKDGSIEFARLDAGTFSEMPHPPLKVSGTKSGKKITLNFESLPPTVADGFTARGKLEAGLAK